LPGAIKHGTTKLKLGTPTYRTAKATADDGTRTVVAVHLLAPLYCYFGAGRKLTKHGWGVFSCTDENRVIRLLLSNEPR